jgi:CDP-diacylglycerol--serine O-phosphatidyltransferase
VGIVAVVEGSPVPPAYFVWAACVFDFFDGFAARWLKVSSAIGKELDSLADMVSFGVLPALVMYRMIQQTGAASWLPYVGLLLAVFSALRLAKFNIDTRQSDSFIGLPTPANALFITALSFLPEASFGVVLFNGYALAAVAVVFSLLLVSPWELFALKFKHFGWKGNQIRFIFVLLSAALLIGWGAVALVPIILIYLLLSFTSRIGAKQ